jgi:hypothetical protein
VVVLRALYDAVPFLLALGLSPISAYVLLTAARMFYVRDVGFARYRLRLAGRKTGAGSVYLVTRWPGQSSSCTRLSCST